MVHGRGVPRERLGIVGDFFINDRVHTIYGPKSRRGWGEATSLIGPRGHPGLRGDPGATGVAGPPGYSVLHGTQPPQPGDGVDNDFYIDTATTQLYGPKQAGVWGSPVSLTGSANIALIDGGSP